MKKILTLSAAIAALSMIGCSDAGLDNSVASTSTSEVKVEKAEPYLAKINLIPSRVEANPKWYENEPLSPGQNGLCYGCAVYGYDYANIAVEMATVADQDWDGYEGQSAYHVLTAPYNPDVILVVTTLVSDCRLGEGGYPDCRGWDETGVAFEFGKNIDEVRVRTPRNLNGRKLSVHKDDAHEVGVRSGVGAVSAFVGIWNLGTPYEIVLKAATYSGGMFKKEDGPELARQVYNMNIKGIVHNRTGLW
jgi:hypothetical protein